MKKQFIFVSLLDIIMYILQFLIIPSFYNNVIGRGNESIAVICMTTILISFMGMFWISDKFRLWLLSIIIYMTLIIIYCPEAAYGIGLAGIDLDGLHSYYDVSQRLGGIIILTIGVILLQLISWCLVKLSKLIISHIKKENKTT